MHFLKGVMDILLAERSYMPYIAVIIEGKVVMSLGKMK